MLHRNVENFIGCDSSYRTASIVLYNDAYRGKREITEIVQNRGVDFLTACAEQDAKEKQCYAF